MRRTGEGGKGGLWWVGSCDCGFRLQLRVGFVLQSLLSPDVVGRGGRGRGMPRPYPCPSHTPSTLSAAQRGVVRVGSDGSWRARLESTGMDGDRVELPGRYHPHNRNGPWRVVG